MLKKVIFIVLALPGSAIIIFCLSVLYLLFCEMLDYGYIDRFNGSEQQQVQFGIAMMFLTLLLFGVFVYLIVTKIGVTKRTKR